MVNSWISSPTNGICCKSLHDRSICPRLQFDDICCSEFVHMVLTEDSPVSNVVKGVQVIMAPGQKRVVEWRAEVGLV